MWKLLLLLIIISLGTVKLFSDTAQEYLDSARAWEHSDIFQALEIMEEAAEKYPDNVDILALYGLMISKGAGQSNFIKARGMAAKAEKIFAAALEIEANHKKTILWRGILRVNVPKFLGMLDQGIADLEGIRDISEPAEEDFIVASYYLGLGYLKKGSSLKAKEGFKIVTTTGSGYPFYEDSVYQLRELDKRK